MELKMKLKSINTNVDFKRLVEDFEKGKHTIKIIGCGLCNYNCNECANPFK